MYIVSDSCFSVKSERGALRGPAPARECVSGIRIAILYLHPRFLAEIRKSRCKTIILHDLFPNIVDKTTIFR